MKAKRLRIAIIYSIIMIIATGTVFWAVLMGHIGNQENWRIAMSGGSAFVFVVIAIISILNYRREQHRAKG